MFATQFKTPLLCSSYTVMKRPFHLSSCLLEIQKMTRLRVVDNSEIGKRAMAEGKPPRCIQVYNKTGVGRIGNLLYKMNKAFSCDMCYFIVAGDVVLVAIKGEKKKGILVGLKQNQKPKVPKFDSNNLVLIDDTGTPLGTRIHVPIPTALRTILKEKTFAKGADYTKILAIASRFV